ncbi:hypothetical protein [Candidatus Solirubrobacter pratensis]|uniref:hypothetical protein n=1 Tax=Candidatus Solirubrobacter pratensis TaxID=1298857 RepID=UPI000423B60B|nr:hypothetical protein [Candidatus Solirubrobacter pratensis]
MSKFLRPGNILGVVAVVLAMSGSAVAASKITSAQIKDGTITGKDIKNGSVAKADLGRDARAGMQGAPGPAGPAGPAGAPGAPGLAGVVTVESQHIDLGPNGVTPVSWMAQCPAGKVVIGTGFVSSIADVGFVKAYGTFVGGIMFNNTGVTAHDLYLQAICASTSGAVASSVGRGTSKYSADRSDAIAHMACTKAKIGGKSKCLQRGQFCAVRYKSQYRKYGFNCVNGRLR